MFNSIVKKFLKQPEYDVYNVSDFEAATKVSELLRNSGKSGKIHLRGIGTTTVEKSVMPIFKFNSVLFAGSSNDLVMILIIGVVAGFILFSYI